VNEMPEIGKISPEIFNELIFPRLGVKSDKVLVGPQHGVDVGIVEIGNKAVSLTCDPVFIVPEYGWERAAWFAIHIIASDAVTCGLKPKFLSIDLNLPMEMTKKQLEVMWNTMHQECERLGISVICGHTARYENCHYPMVGGATIVGVGEKDEYVTPRMAKAGDKIIITKGPAIEATGIFAAMFPRLIEEKFGVDFSQGAQQVFYKMSVVEDAMTAVSVGVREDGVTAMQVEKERIVVEDCVEEICRYFEIAPYASISEGTLIISCREHKAGGVVEALTEKGIKSSVVGELIEPEKGMILIEEGKETKLEHPIVDPFWKAFYGALEKYKSLGGGKKDMNRAQK